MSTPKKIIGRPFPKGVSGNPGGRSKGLAEVQKLARAFTADSIEALASIVKAKKAPPSTKVAAAVALLDRGWGKAPAYIDISAEVRGSVQEMTDADLLRVIADEDDEQVTQH